MNLSKSIRCCQQRGDAPIIAEIKRIIPRLADKRGFDDRDAAYLAGCYERGGAIGISLVTEVEYFGGQPEKDIPAVLQATRLPLLIKDFIQNKDRIDYYADLIAAVDPLCLKRVTLLLITHMVKDCLSYLISCIHKHGMLALVETRGPEDLPVLRSLINPPQLVGINNKKIDELENGEDILRITSKMVTAYRNVLGKALLISESAHQKPADVQQSLAVGADAVLAGTAFMQSSNPAATVASFVQAKREIRKGHIVRAEGGPSYESLGDYHDQNYDLR